MQRASVAADEALAACPVSSRVGGGGTGLGSSLPMAAARVLSLPAIICQGGCFFFLIIVIIFFSCNSGALGSLVCAFPARRLHGAPRLQAFACPKASETEN